MINRNLSLNLAALYLLIQLTGCDLSSNISPPPDPPDPGTGMYYVGRLNTGGDARAVRGFTINQTRYAFIADGSKGLSIVNINDAAAPVLSSSYQTNGFTKDIFVDTINNSTYAFLSDITTGLYIINVSNPASPFLDTLLNYPGGAAASYCKNRILYVAAEQTKIISVDLSLLPGSVIELGRYDAMNPVEKIEIFNQTAYLSEKVNGLEIVNISNPTSLSFYSLITTSSSCNEVRVANNLAYVADGTAGVSVVNVGNPSSPYFVSQTETETNVKGIDYSPNYIFLAENSDGASVLNLFNPAYPEYVGYYIPDGYCYGVSYYRGKVLMANGNLGLLILRF